ncbi:unnamed protein product [Prorocentrum cordatum]|uniref:Uncharacterized protein n=1 Tax=Prorocentrum cordatum TaxID=2364126 RepID=A0ABN9UA21_9DINO|nr:unnamed protein product [Polarella glacialis]
MFPTPSWSSPDVAPRPMDLSHLVPVGLFPARRAPPKPEELSYLQSHGVEESLADLHERAGPEAAGGSLPAHRRGRGEAEQAGALRACPGRPRRGGAQGEGGAEGQGRRRPAARGWAGPRHGGEDPGSVGDQVRSLKERLKAEGLSGTRLNAHEDVKRLVEGLQQLTGGGAAPACARARGQGGGGRRDAPEAGPQEGGEEGGEA